jgi:EAL domain-containing protein (putative c-di-GMP-specific phosphodiesterase class I)
LEGELRQALEDDQFEAYYSRCVLRGRQCPGLQALIRWRRPNDGLTLPAQFIRWPGRRPDPADWERMLALAGRQIAAWRRRPAAQPVAVNLSASSSAAPATDRAVEIASCDVAPSCLELELTETMLMDSVDTAMAPCARSNAWAFASSSTTLAPATRASTTSSVLRSTLKIDGPSSRAACRARCGHLRRS